MSAEETRVMAVREGASNGAVLEAHVTARGGAARVAWKMRRPQGVVPFVGAPYLDAAEWSRVMSVVKELLEVTR